MGCDIHCYIDYSPFSSNPKYAHCLANFFVRRNYELFGLLAGIRGFGPAVIAPKGLPESISYFAEDDVLIENEEGELVKNPDYHTYSWLTIAELAEVMYRYDKKYGRPVNYDVIAIYECMQVLDEKEMNPRFVFWFDS